MQVKQKSMGAEGDRLSTLLLRDNQGRAMENTGIQKLELSREIYPERAVTATQHFLPFFLLTLTHPVEFG